MKKVLVEHLDSFAFFSDSSGALNSDAFIDSCCWGMELRYDVSLFMTLMTLAGVCAVHSAVVSLCIALLAGDTGWTARGSFLGVIDLVKPFRRREFVSELFPSELFQRYSLHRCVNESLGIPSSYWLVFLPWIREDSWSITNRYNTPCVYRAQWCEPKP